MSGPVHALVVVAAVASVASVAGPAMSPISGRALFGRDRPRTPLRCTVS